MLDDANFEIQGVIARLYKDCRKSKDRMGKAHNRDLPFDPYRAMIVRMVDLERSGIEQ
jgi:hypothetical protein